VAGASSREQPAFAVVEVMLRASTGLRRGCIGGASQSLVVLASPRPALAPRHPHLPSSRRVRRSCELHRRVGSLAMVVTLGVTHMRSSCAANPARRASTHAQVVKPSPKPRRRSPCLSSCSSCGRTHIHVCILCRRGLDNIRLPVDNARLPPSTPCVRAHYTKILNFLGPKP
jgi:hypothetical protein